MSNKQQSAVSVIQSMLSKNREEIRMLQDIIADYKTWKREADEEGDLEDEYLIHNSLKARRKQLANLVTYQKLLKKLISNGVV